MQGEENIGKYEVTSTLGKGSMGVVYKALDPEIGRHVAIKTLNLPAGFNNLLEGDENEAIERFRIESRSAGKLRHPNIVMIFDTGQTAKGKPFIVMDYIEGKTLNNILSEGEPLDPILAVHYLAQLASAVDYAHSKGVIHRDIKPANILIGMDSSPHLLDFGVAKLGDSSLTPADTVVGTPSYMAPEQIRGQELSGKVDIFSLAVVAFEMLLGKRPFKGKDFSEVVTNIIQREPRSFSDLESDLPQSLEKILAKGLARSPEKRWSTANEFIEAICFSLEIDAGPLGVKDFGPDSKWTKPNNNSAFGDTLKDWEAGLDSKKESSSMLRRVVEENAFIEDPVEEAEPEFQDESLESEQEFLFEREEEELELNEEQDTGSSEFPDELETNSRLDVQELLASHSKLETTKPRRSWLGVVLGLLAASAYFVYLSLSSAPSGKQLAVEVLPVKVSPIVAPKSEQIDISNGQPITATAFRFSKPQNVPSSGWDESSLSSLQDGELAWVLESLGEDSGTLKKALKEVGLRQSKAFLPYLVGLYAVKESPIRVEVLKILASAGLKLEAGSQETFALALNDPDYLVRGFAVKYSMDLNSEIINQEIEQRFPSESNKVVKRLMETALTKFSKQASSNGQIEVPTEIENAVLGR